MSISSIKDRFADAVTRVRVLLNPAYAPRTEAEVVARYLQEKLYGGPLLINTRLDVEETRTGFRLYIRNGIAKDNARTMDGFNSWSVPARLGKIGFDMSGIAFRGGGRLISGIGVAHIERLQYDLMDYALPANLWGRIGDFQARQKQHTAPKMA